MLTGISKTDTKRPKAKQIDPIEMRNSKTICFFIWSNLIPISITGIEIKIIAKVYRSIIAKAGFPPNPQDNFEEVGINPKSIAAKRAVKIPLKFIAIKIH